MTFYNCKTTAENTYQMTKFDDDLNVESSYEVSLEECQCPAGSRDTCRHRKMLPIFLAEEAVDKPMFYNYDTHQWAVLEADTDKETESYIPITKCPKCGSESLIEDDGIECQDCDWKEEHEEIDPDFTEAVEEKASVEVNFPEPPPPKPAISARPSWRR